MTFQADYCFESQQKKLRLVSSNKKLIYHGLSEISLLPMLQLVLKTLITVCGCQIVLQLDGKVFNITIMNKHSGAVRLMVAERWCQDFLCKPGSGTWDGHSVRASTSKHQSNVDLQRHPSTGLDRSLVAKLEPTFSLFLLAQESAQEAQLLALPKPLQSRDRCCPSTPITYSWLFGLLGHMAGSCSSLSVSTQVHSKKEGSSWYVVVTTVAMARRELPGESFQKAPQGVSGKFSALCGASFNSFNYICGLDPFGWPLKFISQRVVLKGVRNICGHCGFPPGLQEE